MGNEPALRRHWRAFLIALQFLSIVPVRLQPAPEARENGLSLLYYPLVGLLLGLLLAAWIADRLGWELRSSETTEEGISAQFQRTDGVEVNFQLTSVPVGQPSVHPGQMVGLRLIAQPDDHAGVCIILCTESGGCMRLESGGMADLDLHEELVPKQHGSPEMDVAVLLSGGHDTTNPLLATAAPLAARLLP